MVQKGKVIIMKKNNKRKYADFQLDWNFNDKEKADSAINAVNDWVNHADSSIGDSRVKDMINEINPALYDELSRGDKCRVGKAVSKMFSEGCYPGLARGDKKGSTNTYHIEE